MMGAVSSQGWPRLANPPGWLAAALLVAGAAAIGPALGGVSRPLFVAGCAGVGVLAWRQSAAAHLQAAIVLFAFAPFARRLVDVSAGFDPSGVMLVGPLLTILVPASDLRRLLHPGQPIDRFMAPALVVAVCVGYATMLSLFQGDWTNAASGTLKWVAPIAYALTLKLRAEAGLAQAAARAFLVVLPVTALYGIYQYVDPPAWDRYWMSYASITSAGLPEPYAVRVFSTMNSPASFATFGAAGLLLAGFLRPGWQALASLPLAGLALMLSLYRTAWLSLAAGVLFCLVFAATRARATGAVVGGAAAILVAATLTPFAEVITDRLETLGSGAQDGSGQERLGEVVTLWNQPDSGLVGMGFTVVDAGVPGAIPVDGMIVACWLTMGVAVGMLCLAALLVAALQAAGAPWRRPTREAVVLAALAVGALVQLPLAGIASGELGFLFWTFAALAAIETTRRDARPC